MNANFDVTSIIRLKQYKWISYFSCYSKGYGV